MGLNIIRATKESPGDQDIPFRLVAPRTTRLWELGGNSLKKGSKPRHHFLGAKRLL